MTIGAQPEPPAQPAPAAETPTVRVTAAQLDLAAAERAAPGATPQPWREELSDRVERFRKRRARLQPDGESARNLELNFDEPDAAPQENFDRDLGQDLLDRALTPFEPPAPGDEVQLGEPAIVLTGENRLGENITMGAPEAEPEAETVQLEIAPAERDEMHWGEPLPRTEPMEILVGSPSATKPEPYEPEGIYIAPVGRRFLAGIADALVLLLGAAIFGVIFWRFCGRISMLPLNVAVLGLIGAVEIFAYFGVFTALASATPGLLWVGCEIRNLNGAHPSVQESLWRALGVLVSLSALMLGFVWACVDTDLMTWHDRMSGTVITETRLPVQLVQEGMEA